MLPAAHVGPPSTVIPSAFSSTGRSGLEQGRGHGLDGEGAVLGLSFGSDAWLTLLWLVYMFAVHCFAVRGLLSLCSRLCGSTAEAEVENIDDDGPAVVNDEEQHLRTDFNVIMMKFTQLQLREMLTAKQLPVGGNKTLQVERLRVANIATLRQLGYIVSLCNGLAVVVDHQKLISSVRASLYIDELLKMKKRK